MHVVSGPSLGGTIAELRVKEGQRVKRGDILAILDTYDTRTASVIVAEKSFALAELELQQVRWGAKQADIEAQKALVAMRAAELKRAERQVERGRSLVAREIISDDTNELRSLEMQRARENLRQAEARTQALPYLKLPDAALLDSRSRRKFIPIIERLENGREQRLYLQSPGATLAPEMRVIGLYGLGPDFTIDGSFIFSDLNYYRLFQLPLDRLSLGLLTIEPGADLQKVRDAVAAALGDRAKVFTHAEFVAGERDYFLFQTPIGIILGFGLAVGVFIGIVFVMQALYSMIDMNISEYAVLRAMGYRDMFFIALVLQIAVLIGVGAFIPSIGITALIYELVGDATRLRFTLSLDIVGTVFLATIVMGSVAVLFAVRKLRRNNPLDLFG
ncbi:MAG: FtsX-like permease family protein [Oceanibaculum nanhaiense]|uniref:FtsX-like permease family protein n=1 Tax=Oceanibaculum nanhaiense TaxID=1909734 RepID=UPI0032EE9F1E